MASRSVPVPHAAPAASVPRAVRVALARPELLALLVLAAVLNLWGLEVNGWANDYYAAAVRSMAQSWHAFLYGAFDAAGVQTVDKPPLALWVQALSVRVFGFDSLSILVPQALMGVASVGLVYDLTRRRFGRVAGGVAGLVLALTPITVAISRHNNPDALLVLCSVAALWFLVRALEDGRTRWVVLAGVAVGLGFEAKMGAALLVVPGLAAAFAWIAPRGRLAAVRSLAAGGAALVAVAGAWPLLVALTPAADRPWVAGTSDNSILSLILSYNGLGRLDGQAGGPQALGGGGPFGGAAGPLRLLNASLGGQAGWLLGFAVVAGVGLLVASRLRRGDARTGWLIATGGAFLTSAVAFSLAKGIFHPYYVSALAPFTAALVGAGAGEILRGGTLARILGPMAVLAAVATELAVRGNVGGLTWLGAALAARRDRGRRARRPARHARPPGGARRGPGAAAGGAGELGGRHARPRDQRDVPGRRTRRRGDGRAGRRGRAARLRRPWWLPARRRSGGARPPAGVPPQGIGAPRAMGVSRRRDVRRRRELAAVGHRLRQGARRRHDRRVEPVDRRGLDHRLRRERRRPRLLLGPRGHGQRDLARGGGPRRAHPLGARRRRPGRRHARRRARRHHRADADGGEHVHRGRRDGVDRGHALRLRRQGGRTRGRRVISAWRAPAARSGCRRTGCPGRTRA